MEENSKGTALGNVIRIDDDRMREHLGRIVRGTVEETTSPAYRCGAWKTSPRRCGGRE